MGDIEGTKAYIDDILVIKKGSFSEHLEQLEEIFRRCEKANLQLNAEKSHFGVNAIDYLGYIVTPEGIKPNPKKIQATKAHNSHRSEKFYWNGSILQGPLAKNVTCFAAIYRSISW